MAVAVHYLIGLLFSFVYSWLCRNGWLRYSLPDALLFGAATGVLAIGVWRACLALHPQLPRIPVPFYLAVIGASHLVFALVLLISHPAGIPNPSP